MLAPLGMAPPLDSHVKEEEQPRQIALDPDNGYCHPSRQALLIMSAAPADTEIPWSRRRLIRPDDCSRVGMHCSRVSRKGKSGHVAGAGEGQEATRYQFKAGNAGRERSGVVLSSGAHASTAGVCCQGVLARAPTRVSSI